MVSSNQRSRESDLKLRTRKPVARNADSSVGASSSAASISITMRS